MGKPELYQPPEKYKNYLLPNAKPLRCHSFYQEKVWTLQEQIYKKLKTVADLLENLYPKLTDNFSGNIKNVIEKNLKILIKDLDVLQRDLNEDTYSFDKIKTNQRHINEMKNVCSTLQTVRSYEYEFKKLGKIKHALHELEHLIQPTDFEKSLEKERVKNKQKAVLAKKEQILIETKKKKVVSKKAKPTTKKSKAPIQKLKQPVKKAASPKPKKALAVKPKAKVKSVSTSKKAPAKVKKGS